MTYTCPRGHASTDADYCSECGAKIGGGGVTASTTSAPVAPSATGAEVCPDCGTDRVGSAVYCEVCRYNFVTQTSFSPADAPPAAQVVPPPAPVATDPVPHGDVVPTGPDAVQAATVADLSFPFADSATTPTASTMPKRWEVVVTIDPSLYADPDPTLPCPTDETPRVFQLDLPDNLIGRTSISRDIHPEIPLTDSGVSHRHAKLLRQVDGNFVVRDVGSTNGTSLNGKPVEPGVDEPLNDGDQITLGCWTRIAVRAASGS